MLSRFEKVKMGFGIFMGTACLASLIYSSALHDKEVKFRKQAIEILDVNKDGGLSEEELKVFSDRINVLPYTRTFQRASIGELESFVNHYSSK
jgi:hypothetical protein